jgi:SAM-dependent methyltransferase
VRSGETVKLRNLVSSGESKRRSLTGLTVKDGLVRHPFDLEFGVRTSGLVAGRHLATGHRHDRHATAYYAVAPSVFRGILVRWRRCRPLAPLDEFTFIDLGAGLGRALLLASEFPFRSVLGVELNPTLARIGSRNLALWRRAGRARAPLQIIDGDAAEFELPPGPCVAFLFNPFAAPVLRRMLRNWSNAFAGRPVKLDILYVNNEQENVLRRQQNLMRLFHGQIRRSHVDTVAERRILLSQPDAEYAAVAWENCSIYRWKEEAERAGTLDTGQPEQTAGERA